jgi:hypothetical protein
MRIVFVAASLVCTATNLSASDLIASRQQAESIALAVGYPLVEKAELVDHRWDVWASKDGIAYQLQVDPQTGFFIKELPADDD